MKYCKKCGHANADDAMFCAKCGNALGKGSKSKNKKTGVPSFIWYTIITIVLLSGTLVLYDNPKLIDRFTDKYFKKTFTSKVLKKEYISDDQQYTRVWYKDGYQSLNKGDNVILEMDQCDELTFIEHSHYEKSIFLIYYVYNKTETDFNDCTDIYDINGKYLTSYEGKITAEEGNVNYINTSEKDDCFFKIKKYGKCGLYHVEANDSLEIKYDDIIPTIKNGEVIYYDVEIDKLVGRIDSNGDDIIPPVYKAFYKLDEEETAGTGFTGYIVETEDNKIGIYDDSFDAVVREEWGFTEYEFHYSSSDNYSWILLSKDRWNDKVYVAASIKGFQRTEEKKEGYFYKDGNFYYYTYVGSNEGYKYTWPQWKREYYCIQTYTKKTIYGYGDHIKFIQSGPEYKYKGNVDGWDSYDGETYTFNQNTTSYTYYFSGKTLKATYYTSFRDLFGNIQPMWRDLNYSLMSEEIYEKDYYGSWNWSSYSEKIQKRQEEKLSRLIKNEEERKIKEMLAAERKDEDFSEQKSTFESGSNYSVPAIPITPIDNSYMNNVGIINNEIDEAAKQRLEQHYRQMYQQKEELVSSLYNSLTSHGISIQNNNGIYGGTSGNLSSNSSAYIQQKTMFENAKRELRDLRNEASRNGVSILPSQWETTVVY